MTRRTLGAALAALALAPAAAQAHPQAPKPTTYAVIGDTPYGQPAVDAFPSQIAQINADPAASLVMHVGDIKNGSSRCDTSYFEMVRTDFNLFADPLVYTPGDNEWTDCHRTNNGGYQPAGATVAGAPVITQGPSRLDEVRRIFFDRPGRTLGQRTRRIASQAPAFPENARWSDSGVVSAVFNVPGSNNNLAPWFGAAETDALKAVQAEEYRRRNAADLRWLDQTFIQAILTRAPGVLLGIQADMWDPEITGDPAGYSGFTDFVQRLAAWSRAYRKPVLLINGDSHVYGADRPLADPTATNSTIYGVKDAVPNLRRVTVDGSNNAANYLRLTLDPRSKDVFSWERVPYTTG
jgi:hypothetical protein